ncbi:hypothetical protein ACTXT7_014765 [Hymenolepis weldensis]
MEGNEAIFLRIKRRHSEPPIECFNTVPAKRRCLNNESAGVAHFKYLGTSSTTFETTNIALEDFKDVGASGERRIILSTKHVAHIVDSFQDTVQCEVRISSAQCRGVKRKVEVSEENSATNSPPSKSIRIIDLTVKDPSVVISSSLSDLKVNSEDKPSNASSGDNDKQQLKVHDEDEDNDSGFVYDLYAVTSGTENNFNFDSIVYDQDSDEFDRCAFEDDDSDSNSESNWRNDYPDEDDPFAPRSSEIDTDDEDDSERSDESDLYDRYEILCILNVVIKFNACLLKRTFWNAAANILSRWEENK